MDLEQQEAKVIVTNGCGNELAAPINDANGPSPSKKEVEKTPESVCRPVSVKLIRYRDIETECSPLSDPRPEQPDVGVCTPLRRYPKRNRGPPPMYKYEQNATKVVRPRKTKPSESDYFDSWSNCIVAYRYDCEKNFFPEPGPSTINYYIGVDLPGYYAPTESRKRSRTLKAATDATTTEASAASSSESEIARTLSRSPKRRGRKPKRFRRRLISPEHQLNGIGTSPQNLILENDDECDDIMMKSFYVDSPSMLHNTFADSPLPLVPHTNGIDDSPLLGPAISKFMTCISSAASPIADESFLARIKATESAPSRLDVTNALESNEFPKVVNKRPFYSNPKDINVSNRTEVGHTVLQLGGASIADCEPFASQLNIVGLNNWRKLTMSNMIVPINGKKQSAQQQTIEMQREMLASDKPITIIPLDSPPSSNETDKWIQVRNRMGKGTTATKTNVNDNGYHVNEYETIVIDDDSEPEMATNNWHSSEKTVSNGSSPSLLNGYTLPQNADQSDDVICLDDSDDDNANGKENENCSHFKISIISSPTSETISLQDGIDKIAKEVSAVSTERNFS